MDAHSHLKRLGWKGWGYPLGRSNSGITKPILISHKTDFLGLGAKQQKEKQADQWWLRAFENALQDFGTDKQSEPPIVQSVGFNRSGLHAYFAKGQGLKSTFSSEDNSTSNTMKRTRDQSTEASSAKTQPSTASSSGLEPLTLGHSERYLTQVKDGNKRKSSGDEVVEPAKKRNKTGSTSSNKKEKKRKKKHKLSGADHAQRNTDSQREKQIGAGTFDHDSDELRDLPLWSITATPTSVEKVSTISAISSNNSRNAHRSAGSIIHTTDTPLFNKSNGSNTGKELVTNTSTGQDQDNLEPSNLIWHPDMLGDRRVKDLSKEERKARLEWMRERRALKHAAAGKKVMSMKERQKRRGEKKMKQRGRLVAKILQGKSRKDATKDELRAARKKAKWMQRELKKEKRNKVIHRDKASGGHSGTIGGKIE